MNTLKKLMTPKNMAILLLILFAIFLPALFKVFVVILAALILLWVIFTMFFILADCVETNSWKPLESCFSKFISKQ